MSSRQNIYVQDNIHKRFQKRLDDSKKASVKYYVDLAEKEAKKELEELNGGLPVEISAVDIRNKRDEKFNEKYAVMFTNNSKIYNEYQYRVRTSKLSMKQDCY